MSNRRPRSYLDLLRDEPLTGYALAAMVIVALVTLREFGPRQMAIVLTAITPLFAILVILDDQPRTIYSLATKRLAVRLRGTDRSRCRFKRVIRIGRAWIDRIRGRE